jgi:hypothetical protein
MLEKGKGYPYHCGMCNQDTLIIVEPSVGLIFKCLECMEAAEIVDIIHTQANHKGMVGIITRHVTNDELEELEKKGKIAVYDWARERPDDIER